MKKKQELIWIDTNKYPNYPKGKFCIAEFKKTIDINAPLEIQISALSRYMLFINGRYIGRGPTSVGGDFVMNGKIEANYYETYTVDETGKIEIKVLVTSVPTAMTEYDFGESGLWVNIYSDGNFVCEADSDWQCRVLEEWEHIFYIDYTKQKNEYSNACWAGVKIDLVPSPIPHLTEEKILPINFEKIVVEKEKTVRACLFFDKIYSAYPHIKISAQGKCVVNIISSEEGAAGKVCETIVTHKDICHFSPRMRSIGQIELEITNLSDNDVAIEELYIDYVHYPVYEEGGFSCSDILINKIYDVCMHTLKICRQTIHLDSPTHQEPLACTGDYYIQSLIEYLSLGDPTLAKWDIKRTSWLLNIQNGRLFHTSYSLIYPWWVYDHYMHTGDKAVIDLSAIKKLLNRFSSYLSQENGLIEYAPDYMFVDWVVASAERDEFLDGGNMMSHGKMEGYSLHHPPKALGQSVLCMLYYNALVKISYLYDVLDDKKSAEECRLKAENVKKSINKHLFDKSKGLYVGGLNTENLVEENEWLPQNTKVVYYLKQANILAVLFGIAEKDKRQSILEYVLKDLNKFEIQPYFYHFLFNALYQEGMFDRYGMSLIKKYESLINKCDKGLMEAWENMNCDFSHAWGATPAYTLKRALSGLEILEPGFKKIKLNPKLFNLEYANYQITTPFGKIEICQKKGEEVSIIAPKEIKII